MPQTKSEKWFRRPLNLIVFTLTCAVLATILVITSNLIQGVSTPDSFTALGFIISTWALVLAGCIFVVNSEDTKRVANALEELKALASSEANKVDNDQGCSIKSQGTTMRTFTPRITIQVRDGGDHASSSKQDCCPTRKMEITLQLFSTATNRP